MPPVQRVQPARSRAISPAEGPAAGPLPANARFNGKPAAGLPAEGLAAGPLPAPDTARGLRLQLLLPALLPAPPPAWLAAALQALRALPGVEWLAPAGAGAGAAAAAPADIVLALAPGGGPPPAAASTAVLWLLCDGDCRPLDPQWPLLQPLTSGHGIALQLLQRAPAPALRAGAGEPAPPGPQWQQRRRLHLAASPRYSHGLAALPGALQRLVAQALVDHRLGVAPAAAAVALQPAAATPLAWRRAALRLQGWQRAALARQRARWCSEFWRIGVIDAPLHTLLRAGAVLPPVRWLTPERPEGYWADPFGLAGDPQRLWCEYFDEASGVGHLETLQLDASGDAPSFGTRFSGSTAGIGSPGATRIAPHILTRTRLAVGAGRHASFPHVFEAEGQRLGLAETVADGECVLHAVADDGAWTPLHPLLPAVRAADPALFCWQGRWWLAYTDIALGTQDNLCLQHAPSLHGPWQPHANNPVRVDVAGARMAGRFVVHDGVLYRPGQDCLAGYGAAVVVYRVLRLTPGAYDEVPLQRLAPDRAGPCPHGLHTLTAWGARTLIDGKRLGINRVALRRKLARRDGGAAPALPAAEVHGARAPDMPAPDGPAPDVPAPDVPALDEPAPDAAATDTAVQDRPAPAAPAHDAQAQDRVCIYIPHLRLGGAETSLLRLAAGFAASGLAVDVLVHTLQTQELAPPPGVQVHSLGCGSTAAALPRLVRWLRRQRPRWLLSAFPHTNLAAVAAVALARCGTRCVVSEHAPLSRQIAQQAARRGPGRGWQRLHYRLLPPAVRWAYGRAAAVVAVSAGVRDDLRSLLGPAAAIHVIANPVLPPTLDAELAQPASHPWLRDPALRVVLSVCRLSAEKDLAMLIHAFAALHAKRPTTRLLLAGDGPERGALQALIDRLQLSAVAQLPGRTGEPLRWMRQAAVFALASQYEGFGNVLVEAMACGTPVVSTDCPVGPRDILHGGALGRLVPVGDAAAMASALASALDAGPPPAAARQVALQYTHAAASAAYLQLLHGLHGLRA